jgi:hypothetical protein
MDLQIKESDWKLFSKELRPVALERYCERVLSEMAAVASDQKRTYHQRYLAVYRLMEKRDRELADAFNDPRRSRALFQLAHIRRIGLLTDEEMGRFGEETRRIIDDWLKIAET